MMFDKLFQKDKAGEALREQRQQENVGMILGQPNAQIDEQRMIERQEVLIQLTRWQQSRTAQMQQLFEKLSAYTYDKEKNALIPSKWDTPYCSLVGAAKLVNYIEPLDHNVMLANWSDKVLNITMRDAIAHPLRRFIRDNHNELGIAIEHAEYVFWNICNTVEPNYWRGWNDGERRKDREMIKINEVKSLNEPKKKTGLFGLGG
jgi:hypothetical protein